MTEVNSQFFTEKDVENGVMTDYIMMLCKQSYASESFMNDIHVIPEDAGCFRVEHIQFNSEFRTSYPRFMAVGDNEIIVHEVVMPDGTIEYSEDAEMDQFLLENYFAEHKSADDSCDGCGQLHDGDCKCGSNCEQCNEE